MNDWNRRYELPTRPRRQYDYVQNAEVDDLMRQEQELLLSNDQECLYNDWRNKSKDMNERFGYKELENLEYEQLTRIKVNKLSQQISNLKILARRDDETEKRAKNAARSRKRQVLRRTSRKTTYKTGFRRVRAQNCLSAKAQQQILFLKLYLHNFCTKHFSKYLFLLGSSRFFFFFLRSLGNSSGKV
jgi:hypothetical protein